MSDIVTNNIALEFYFGLQIYKQFLDFLKKKINALW